MAASTQGTSQKLYFLEEMAQHPDRIPNHIATFPGILGLCNLYEEAALDPIRFKNSILSCAPFILEIQKSVLQKPNVEIIDNSTLKKLDARIIEILSVISAETMTKATEAFADFQSKLPQILKQSIAPTQSEAMAKEAIADLVKFQESLTDSQKEVLKSCQTAEDVATKLIGALTQQFKDETLLEDLMANILEKTTLSTPVNKEQCAKEVAFGRVTKAMNTVVSGLVHLSNLQK